MLATSLDIRGFKAFEDCTIPLQPMSVVVGANGVGKTTVLQAMALFGQLTKQSLPSMLESTGWDYSDLPHLRSRDQRFGVTAHFAGESLEWELSLQTRRRPGIHIERVTQDGEPLMWRDGRTMGRLNQAGRLAIAAMFELDDTPSVVLLDEIENGLHPHLLRGVVEMLQDLVDESDGRTQVIATTHSPIALNYVRDASQILVGYRDQDSGAAKVSPMVDPPRYEALSAYFDKGSATAVARGHMRIREALPPNEAARRASR